TAARWCPEHRWAEVGAVPDESVRQRLSFPVTGTTVGGAPSSALWLWSRSQSSWPCRGGIRGAETTNPERYDGPRSERRSIPVLPVVFVRSVRPFWALSGVSESKPAESGGSESAAAVVQRTAAGSRPRHAVLHLAEHQPISGSGFRPERGAAAGDGQYRRRARRSEARSGFRQERAGGWNRRRCRGRSAAVRGVRAPIPRPRGGPDTRRHRPEQERQGNASTPELFQDSASRRSAVRPRRVRAAFRRQGLAVGGFRVVPS